MAKKGSFSKVYDKNGDYVDVEAARFDGTRTFRMQGDVSATQTWNGDSASALTLNTSIGAKKVTTDKINDKAVGTGQLADGAVGLTQIDDNAMTSAATSGDDRLITSGGVRTEIDNAILNRGKDYGPMTPTQINAISETIPTGSTVHVTAAGTITDGDIEVRHGEDLKYYRGNGEHYWYSMDGDFKLKQQAKTSPTASGNALSFIDSITQDENGEISATKKTVQDGTTSQKGVVQLEDSHSSTSTTKAATPNSVKEAYDLANTANTGAVKNVAYDSTNKKITKTINGQTTDVVSAATLKTDMALNNVDNTSDANKPVSTAQQAALDLKLDKTGDGKDVTATFTEASTRANIGTGEKLSVIFGKIKKWFSDLGTAAFKNVPASGDASSTEVVLGSDTRLSAGASAVQDVTVDGASVVNSSTKVAVVPNASTSAKGAVQLAGSIGATVASENNKAASEKAVRDAINALDAEVTSNDGTNVQVKVTEADGKISAVNVTTDNTENKNNKVSSWQTTPDDTHYPSEKLVKDALNAKADASKIVGIADATYTRENENGSGWNKLASIENFGTWRNNMGMFDLYFANLGSITKKATLLVNVRWDSNRTNANIVNATIVWDVYDSTFKVTVVNRASSTSVITEIWAYLPKGNYSMALSYRSGSTMTGSSTAHAATFTDNKNNWSFFSYLATSVEKPTEDLTNYVKVKDADEIILQKNITSPTNNNLVAMDENGLVKDSGLTKSSVESAITSAGSAIQGVKVNNTTLTPDANKVVTVPLATTSADGAMSAADKTKLNNAVTKKTGIAYKSTAGGDVFKIAEKAYSRTASHSEQFVFHVSYSKHSTNAATSELNVLLKVLKDSDSEVTVFRNTVTSKQGFGALEWTFKASVDDTNGLFTLYAVRTAGQYTTVEATCIAANSERNNLIDNVVVFENTTAELPETVFTETTLFSATSSASSGTAPVKVDAYGALTPITFRIIENRREDSLRAGLPMWHVSQGQFDLPNDGNICYVELDLPTTISAVELFIFVYRSGSPYFIKVRLYTFAYGEPGIVVLDRNGYTNTASGISDIIIRWTGSSYKAYFKVAENKMQFRYLSTSELSNSNFSILTSAQYNALTSTIRCSAIDAPPGAISTSARNRQRNYEILDTGDVRSTYIPTGSGSTDPINGVGVSLAIAGKQDTLSFMTTEEAHSLWTNAKANAS